MLLLKKKDKEEIVNLAARVPKALHQKFKAQAATDGKDMKVLIINFIKKYVGEPVDG